MKSLYERPELGISTEDFIPPELLTIAVDCGEITDANQKEKSKPKADLQALGF